MSNKTDILNELKELSPFLFKLKENDKPLMVPDAYFEQLEDSCMSEINAASGLLASIKKEKTEVPATYFDTFSDKILTKIKEQEQTIAQGKITEFPKQENKIFFLFKRVAIAASFIGIIAFGIQQYINNKIPVTNCEDGIACLTQEEIYQYMNTNAQDFDMQEIQEAVQPVLEKQGTEMLNQEISEKEIEQYIEQNNNIIEAEDALTDIF